MGLAAICEMDGLLSLLVDVATLPERLSEPQLPSPLQDEPSNHHDQSLEDAPQFTGDRTAWSPEVPTAHHTIAEEECKSSDTETSQHCPRSSNSGDVPILSDVAMETVDDDIFADAEGVKKLQPEACEDRLRDRADEPESFTGSPHTTWQSSVEVEDATLRTLSWKVVGRLFSNGLAASACREGLLYRCSPLGTESHVTEQDIPPP